MTQPEDPRTRHLLPDGKPRFTNRLIHEPSPYLRQHAHNPVDWRPWGAEAFELARETGRPVLLSVGYATCHWCHVMEEESFEDLEIAAFINEHTVPVKVDREERPDVDAVYMAAVQLFTGHGGWPMTLWLNAEREPFYAGTYFPARDGDRGGGAGFLTLLRALDRAWREDPRVATSAATASQALREALRPERGSGPLPGPHAIAAAIDDVARRFDRRWGGLAPAPKFPASLPARLLLRQDRLVGSPRARDMALHSLERMASGGMNDQLDGGFHRYSTDARWLVPHFEKMLYDNALLSLDYLEAWQASGDAAYAQVVRETLGWVLARMRDPRGGFYAATDADSLGPHGAREEGLAFTWTPAELRAALSADQARVIEAFYGVVEDGHLDGRSVLHRAADPARIAGELGLEPRAFASLLAEARERLLAARQARPQPLRDEKILAAWNGLAIQALARAGRLLQPGEDGPDGYLAAARAAASFLEGELLVDGRLRRVHKDDRAYVDAVLEDHSFVIAGLLELFQAGGERRWLDLALRLQASLDERFADPAGGYFRTAEDGETLLAREKPVHDGAMPSGNAVQARNLLWLAALTGDDAYRQRADRLLVSLEPTLRRAPLAVTALLGALQLRHAGTAELVLVAPGSRDELRPWLAALAPIHAPGLLVVPTMAGPELDALAERSPLLRGRGALDGRVTAYLCRGGACELPMTEPEALVAAVEALHA
jgi:uncharacterized protein YyaL (SSP411 family)